MRTSKASQLHEEIAEAAIPLRGDDSDFDALLDRLGDARYALLGEATHGTHEFYRARAEITKRLITEKGFSLVAWEADWPDALRVNRFVQHRGGDRTPEEALDGFKRFPIWMWRNQEIVRLVAWLREYNAQRPRKDPPVGVYGLDLYSLHTSMAAVIAYLETIDPEAAAEARRRYACFEDFGDDPQSYGMTAALHRSLSCEEQVVQQLIALQQQAGELLRRDGPLAEDEFFYAEQNALVAKNAEKYYRAMYRGRPNTWNLRDTHMVDTLDNLISHFSRRDDRAKALVWAHNSHLGDASATQMSRRDELNVGQLVRERHREQAVLVGFTTSTGTVTAASDWGGITERKRVLPAMEGSFERLFHESASGDFMLRFDTNPALRSSLGSELLERAIGVIYLPETERYSHYFFADLGKQFDVVLHYDETRAVEPLEKTSEWDDAELPETYPSGL
jgi:erythromycin esterase-like protein